MIEGISSTKVYEISGAKIIQQAPTYRTIFDYNRTTRHRLFLPYMVYIQREFKKSPYLPVYRDCYTLHVGFRNEPLDENIPFKEQEWFHPPFANIFQRWNLSCGAPHVHRFWGEHFYFDFQATFDGWLGDIVRSKLFGDVEQWKKLPPEECLRRFRKCPQAIREVRESNDIFICKGSKRETMKVCRPLSEALGEISVGQINYVNGHH